jgi:hypothetical protein
MAKDKKKETGLEILKATYGVAPNFQDVTEEAKKLIKDGELSFTVSAQELGILDPAPGVTKTFQAQVVINGGKPTTLSKDDNQVFAISAPPVKDDTKPSHFLNLYTAVWYGLVAVFTGFFAMSAYKFGVNAFGHGSASTIIGVILAGIALISFGWFGLAAIPIIVFLVCLYSPDYIDLNYDKNLIV